MKEKIKQSVKTLFSKYGLKDATRDKFVNMVEASVSAMGTIENEDEVIATEVAKLEPFAQMVQSELDAVRASQQQNPGQQIDVPSSQPSNPDASSIPEWAKSLMKKMEDIEHQKENEAKHAATNEKMQKAMEIMKNNGAVNDAVRDIAMRFIDVTDEMTAEQIAEKGNAVYNLKYKELYADGYSPAPTFVGSKVVDNPISEEQRKTAIEENQKKFRNQIV